MALSGSASSPIVSPLYSLPTCAPLLSLSEASPWRWHSHALCEAPHTATEAPEWSPEECQPSRSFPRCTLPRLIPTPSHLHTLTPSSLVSLAVFSFTPPPPQIVSTLEACFLTIVLSLSLFRFRVCNHTLFSWPEVFLICECCSSCVMGLEALDRDRRHCKAYCWLPGPHAIAMIIAPNSLLTSSIMCQCWTGEHARPLLSLSGTIVDRQ